MTRALRILTPILWLLFVANLLGLIANLAADNPEGAAFHIKGAIAAGMTLLFTDWLECML